MNKNLRRIIAILIMYNISTLALSAPTTYKSVYNDPKKTQVSPYHYNQYPNYHRPDQRYPAHGYPQQHYPHRPQISVVTPNVGVYISPQPQYHYQQTEEVYLPYGGTYRKTTDYIPQNSRYVPIQPQPRKIIKQGHFYIEQDME